MIDIPPHALVKSPGTTPAPRSPFREKHQICTYFVRQKLRPFSKWRPFFALLLTPLFFHQVVSTYSVTPWIFTVSVCPSVFPSAFSCNEFTLCPLDECRSLFFFSVWNSAVFEISKFVRNIWILGSRIIQRLFEKKSQYIRFFYF
jgi:hypothetical protein